MKKAIIVKKSTSHTLVFDKKYPEAIDVQYLLEKQGVEFDLYIKIFGRGKHHMNVNIEVVHQKKNTTSRVRVLSALSDTFQAKVFGTVKIEKRAKKSHSNLIIKTLLLSERARIISKPFMEILNNDVQASHGVSIGRIDENQLFYLQSRGFTRAEAEETLLKDFFV